MSSKEDAGCGCLILLVIIIAIAYFGYDKYSPKVANIFNVGNFLVNDDDDTSVNIIEQAKPQIMVIPSDFILQKKGCLEPITTQGGNTAIRDYEKYLNIDKTGREIISSLQKEFNKQNYSLLDLSQSLKSIRNQAVTDEVSGYTKDTKTLLLSTIRPDYYLEYDYNQKYNKNSFDINRKLSITLKLINSYTDKVIASISASDKYNGDLSKTLNEFINDNIDDFLEQLNNDFKNTITKGREITVRICVNSSSNIDLSSESEYGDTFSDWIIDYMKLNTKKGTYKLQMNTSKEMQFVDVRINTINPDGTQFNAYDWGRQLVKKLSTDCGIKASNETQGLADVIINIKGLK